MTRDELIEHLQKNYYPDEVLCPILWSGDDVTHMATQDGESLSSEEVDAILKKMKKCHDSTTGITWSTISYYISIVDQI